MTAEKFDVDRDLAFSDIQFADVARFFTAKNIPPHCEMCRSEDWNTHDSEDGTIPVIAYVRKDGQFDVIGASSIYMMSCDNCGNTRIFNRHKISEWLNFNKEVISENG
ncbi:hypothetical protein [Methylobacterium sp. B4]|uniref:hypothetical protein n=1 Tax=Methylobacterium sp. B4 TaxID=1938755 RepID=UPI0011B37C48|nr:hypothetical protein [Methylobacterium sp. B4]